MIAERGGCSFVTKARNIQKWGGRIAVIVDNTVENNPERIIMIDDGTGSDILISTILIGNDDGKKLINFISKGNTTAHLGLDFSIEAPDDRVEYDIYYSLGDMSGYKVLSDFYKFHSRLGKKVLFTPHIFIKKERFLSSSRIYNPDDCVAGTMSTFCTQITDHNINCSGKVLVEEGVRQMCIYKTEMEKKGADKYWKYMTKIKDTCKGDFNEKCSQEAQKSIGIKTKDIEACYKANFSRILEDEYLLARNSSIHYTPAVVVNNITIRGVLEAPLIFNTICHGFNTTIPECEESASSSSIQWSTVMFIMISFSIASFFTIYYCVRKSRKEMNAQLEMHVSAAVTHYMSLKNQSKPLE